MTINDNLFSKFITSIFLQIIGMEIKQQNSEKGSQISYMQLQNSKDSPTPDDRKFIMKEAFLKNLLKINLNGISNNQKKDHSNYETDQGFLNQLFQIVEKHDPILQNPSGPQDLSDQTCQYIHKLCQRHALANKFNIYSDCEPSKVPAQLKCVCGCGKAEGELLSICTDEVKHYFFGPIIILYFFFLRKIVILLVVIGLVYGLYSIITNVMLAPQLTNQCTENPGMLAFLCPIKYLVPTLNKVTNFHEMQIQVWLGFVFCCIWLIAIRIIRSMGRIFNRKIDASLDSSSDYAIQICNLPFGEYTENQLIQYVASLWKSLKGKNAKPLAIKSVQIVYQMDQARKMINLIIQNARKLAANLTKKQKDGKVHYQIKQGFFESYEECKLELIQSMIAIEDYRQKFVNSAEFRKRLSTDIAFLQFNDSNDQVSFLKQIKQYRLTLLGQLKQYVVNQLFHNEESYIFKGNSIRITRAPEPSDINWLNCEKKNSYKRIALVWVVAFILVCISFGFLTLIRYLRTQFQVLKSLSILVSISLQAFNRIIWNTLLTVISYEQNNTSTDNVISTLNKAAFAQAVNAIVLPLIFNYVMRKNLYGSQGLVSSAIDYHFTFFFMQIFLNVINVPYRIKRLTLCIPPIRNYIIRKYSKVVGVVDTAEQIKQVIAYYEYPSFSVASNYASLNTIIFQTMFYIHMQPALIFFLIFNILSVYTIQKYLLLKRCKIPELFDFIIFQNSCSFLQHVPLVYGAGSLVWMHLYGAGHQYSGFSINFLPSILCIAFWLIYLLNPFSVLNKLTKFIMPIFGYNQSQDAPQEQQMSASQQKMFNNNSVQQSTNQDNRVFKRRQCYYNKCGTNQLLQYEAKLTQIKKTDEYENQNKLFCQSFFLKPIDLAFNMMTASINKKAKKSTRKMLPNIKQSFVLLKQSKNMCSQVKKNNSILPIDVCTFNQRIKSRESRGQQKQNINLNKRFRPKHKQSLEQPGSINQLVLTSQTKNI